MGGDIGNFEEAFGPTSTEQDLGGTKVITMDSSSGSLAGDGLVQLEELERQLAEVAESATLTGAVVVFHHPTADPLPDALSQLSVGGPRSRRSWPSSGAARGSRSRWSAGMRAFTAARSRRDTLVNGSSGSPRWDPGAAASRAGRCGPRSDAGVVGEHPSTQDRVDCSRRNCPVR